jgi:hypothetical protein
VADYDRTRGPRRDLDRSKFKNLVVWDYVSGKIITSWRPELQVYDGADFEDGRPPRHFSEPAKFAISPDGSEVVDGKNGVITLYKIENERSR